ncbi:MAG: ATP-binding protein [Flavobacterium sp.]|uniref:tetratricopeptide repeat-containing sensor histidine kinase n=1 Tax=Flavobacterium sp. TaxID=239 RepID=UPI00261B9A16|nr:ATP-binding protein [Flavobacterium sp.]MDD5151166.1 ATP-binding protein [Flavobacterium sp.]
MILKKVHFPIYILLAIFLSLYSCEEKQKNQLDKKNNLIEIDRLIDLGDKSLENVKYDSAFYYHNKAKSLCDVKTDSTRIIYSLARMSEIQQNQGDYSGSETTAIEALPFLNKTMDPSYESSIYNLLGIVYLKLFDYDNALYYYKKGLNLNIDEIRKLKIKHNIAVVYMAKQDYNRAIQILLPLTSKKEVINDPAPFSKALDNLGYSYFKVGNSKGIDYLNQALKIKKQIKDNWGMAASYLHLTKYYKQTNPRLSNNYARLAYEKATKANNVDDRLESLALLIHTQTGNQSKVYSEKYIQINDSISKVRQKEKNQFAKMKYDSKQDKEENLILKTQKSETALELEQQKNGNLILIFITIIGTLSTLFIYSFFKAINKKEKIQTAYDTETRISKKLHDELANDVYQAMSFAETQDLSSEQNKEKLLNNLDTIYSRTRNISLENSEIDTGEYFKENLLMLISGFNNNKTNVIIKNYEAINWSNTKKLTKITVYRIIQELLVNMKKHSQCSIVVLGFENIEKTYEINYSDNGIGSPKTLKFKNGLQNVGNRIKTINGTFTFDTELNKGFKAKIIFPH